MEYGFSSEDFRSNIPTTPKRRRQSLEDSRQFGGIFSLSFGNSQKRPRTPTNSDTPAIVTTLGYDQEEVPLERTLPIIGRTADRDPRTHPASNYASLGSDDRDDDITMDDVEVGPSIMNLEDVDMQSSSSSLRPEQPQADSPSISSACRCFGMLLINQIYLKPGFLYKPNQEVTIDGFVIRDPVSGTYGGMFDENVGTAILELSSTYPVSFGGTLRGEKRLSVLVYGALTDAKNIGEYLYRRKFFLQHPGDTFDSPQAYFNPQWLTPPGQEFRVVCNYDETETDITSSVWLTTKDRPIVSELLDSATGPIQFSEIQSSMRLLTELKTYQKKALAMMVEKELGKLQGEGAEFPAVWERMYDSTRPPSPIYRNTITGRTTTQRPTPCLGGLIADEMGLGKTLTALALIAGTVDKDDLSIGEDGNPTLIIAPLTSRILPGKDIPSISSTDTASSLKLGRPDSENRIEDLGAIVEFLRVSPFNRPTVFQNLFVPVGDDVHETWKRLRLLVKATSLRRTKLAVQDELNLLPSIRIDQPVQLNTEEREIYDLLKRSCIRAMGPFSSTRSTFQLITRLRQVCNHGRDLLPDKIQQWLHKNTLCSEDVVLKTGYCENCEETMDDNEDTTSQWLPCFHQVCIACQKIQSDDDEQDEAFCPEASSRNSIYHPSSKVTAMLRNLNRDCSPHIYNQGDAPVKSIIFSEWIGMLDLVVQALRIDNISFQRIDGRKSLTQRKKALDIFRNDPSCNVLLATLGSAGVGIDLSAASRVHLLEPGWNRN
ncbi:hypothetical protein NM208_g1223 [Fusarium decemcellulare]|uniref:Uncharacterized protein n=1 Tax=Fusarium decemcellulare TaxID=57161 RepID=A0ACC1SWY5_9HYPO|nr:hypothetical protein NM208_g1223 [Fusarium decemcellulare]